MIDALLGNLKGLQEAIAKDPRYADFFYAGETRFPILKHLSPLQAAIANNQAEVIKYLASLPNVDLKKKIVHGEYAGQNSLHLATLLKNKEMVRLLVEGLPVGKRIDPREIMTEGRHQGSSALGLSIALYNAELAKYYLKETPEVLRYTREQIQLEDALHLSVVTGLVELFPILLGELGLSIETKGNTGRYKHLTPLQLATVNRQLDMMKNLVGLGANHRVIASEGKYTGYNLLGLIMLSPGDDTKSIEIIDYLMEDLGHSLEFSNQKSQNAVNLSIFTGQLEIFMHLVKKVTLNSQNLKSMLC